MTTKESINRTVVRLVSEGLRIKSKQVLPESTMKSLGADSMDALDIFLQIEGEFGVDVSPETGPDLEETISGLVDRIHSRMHARSISCVEPEELMSMHINVEYAHGTMAQHRIVGKALEPYADKNVLSVVYGRRQVDGVRKCHVHITYTERK